MIMKRSLPCLILLAVSLLTASPSLTAQAAGSGASELSKQAANPLADLISLPVQNNTDFGLGEFDRTRNVMNIQPVVPFFDGKLITRTIFPVVWLPDVSSESGTTSGLGDVFASAWYATTEGNRTLGFGGALEIPTGGENRGTQKWSAGPTFVALVAPGAWTLGILTNNVWSFAGEENRGEVNRGLLQYFIVQQLGNGWYWNSAPIITVNWLAADGQKWLVPFGVGGGKLVFLGKLPINAQVGAYYNVVKPDIGPDWQLRIQLQTLFPR
jgi:hypothetical protein